MTIPSASEAGRQRPSVWPALAGTLTGWLLMILAAACVPAPPSAIGTTTVPGTSQPRTASPLPVATGPTPPPSFSRPTPTAFPTFAIYQVAPGDTLTSIARRFETTPRSIAFWNGVRFPSLDPDGPGYAPNDIRVGWDLVLVPGVDIADEQEPPSPPPASPIP